MFDVLAAAFGWLLLLAGVLAWLVLAYWIARFLAAFTAAFMRGIRR